MPLGICPHMKFESVDCILLRMADEPRGFPREVIEHDGRRFALIELGEFELICAALDPARVRPLPEHAFLGRTRTAYADDVVRADLVKIEGEMVVDESI